MQFRFLGINTGTAVILGCTGAILWSAYEAFGLNNMQVYAENGFLENIQAALLAVTCLIFFAGAFLQKEHPKPIFFFCALLCYAFLLRELEVQDFDLPAILIFLGTGAGRNASIGIALAAIVGYCAIRMTYYFRAGLKFTQSTAGWLMISGGVFLLIGDIFDKEVLDIAHNAYYEESAELIAYLLIFLASLVSNPWLGKLGFKSNPDQA